MAVDATHIYWINNGTDTIGRANLDGTDVDQSFITGALNPFGISSRRRIDDGEPSGTAGSER